MLAPEVPGPEAKTETARAGEAKTEADAEADALGAKTKFKTEALRETVQTEVVGVVAHAELDGGAGSGTDVAELEDGEPVD